jgi:teichuronic acid biosynthesis glycosyltransferase TuaG
MPSTVSVITPTYNSEKYISECIDSVRAQTFQDWEMVIVDDCSSDGTIAVLESYQRIDPRVILIQNESNLGPATTRNRAIERASGRYIAFLDSDDVWLPVKLDTQLGFMEANGADLSYTSYEKISEDGDRTGRIVHVPPTTSYGQLLNHSVIGCLTAIYDTQSVGKTYMPEIKRRQDYALWLKILRNGHVARGLDEPLAYLRVHKGSLSSNKLTSLRYTWQVYRNIEHLSWPRSAYHLINNAVRSSRKFLI